MKEQYVLPETEYIQFRIRDVISTSDNEEHETPIVND